MPFKHHWCPEDYLSHTRYVPVCVNCLRCIWMIFYFIVFFSIQFPNWHIGVNEFVFHLTFCNAATFQLEALLPLLLLLLLIDNVFIDITSLYKSWMAGSNGKSHNNNNNNNNNTNNDNNNKNNNNNNCYKYITASCFSSLKWLNMFICMYALSFVCMYVCLYLRCI